MTREETQKKAMQPETLAQLLVQITTGSVTSIPLGEEWAPLMERLGTPGIVNEVAEETWDYFLDVLPPRWIGSGSFAFAEGEEPFRFFWRNRGKFYCRPMTWEETREFVRLARRERHAS